MSLDVHGRGGKRHLYWCAVPQELDYYGGALRRPGRTRTGRTNAYSPLRFQRSSAKCICTRKRLRLTNKLGDVGHLAQTLKTKATHIHESWKGSTTSGYDIALLELDQSVDLPEPLFAQQTANFDEDQEFTFVGWGRTRRERYPRYLQMATSLVQLAPQPCGEQLSFHPKDHIVCVESPEVTQEACRGGLIKSVPSFYS